MENRVWVTVHNRGTLDASAPTQVSLYYSPTIGPGPAFPFGWTYVGSVQTQVPPGPSGESRVLFEWQTLADLPPHVCLIATVSTEGDEAPAQADVIFHFNRNNNNVTQRNVHLVTTPEIRGDIANYERAIVPIVFWIEALDVPIGTVFDLTYQTNISMIEFPDNGDLRQMDVGIAQAGRFTFTRTNATQQFFLMQTDLPPAPPGDPNAPVVPFRSPFVLEVILPGGTPTGEMYLISIDQVSFDHETGFYGDSNGGNTYEQTVGFE